ncbi:MAG TPA: tetratricopeptide repeat protein [Saprospiraceae bacterium]|nr:tetratricopeptide repeat protein [Saprospiraceae bacterium]
MLKKTTKQDQTLNKLIADFEVLGNISPQLRTEKSYVKLIQYYEKHRVFEKAIEVSEIAIHNYPYRVDLYLLKAKSLLSLGKPNEVLDVLFTAHQIAPYETEIQLIKAKAFCLIGRSLEALQIIDEVKYFSHKTERLEILLVEAFIQGSMKDYDKMFFILQEALRINPNNLEALEQIWVSVEISKRFEESIKLHKELIDQNPYSSLAWYNLGHAYSCIGEYKEAVDALEYSYLINPKFEQGYLDAGELFMQMHDYNKALQCFLDVNEIFGIDPDVTVQIAECFIKLDRHQEAKYHLLRAIDIEPYNEELYFYLGECYAREENWDKALRYYLESLELDDYREEFHFGIAIAYEKLGQLKKSETHYRKAASCGCELSYYWAKYITFLLQQRNLEKAEKVIQRAEKKSFGADILFTKSAYKFILNEEDEAMDILREALEEDPKQINFLKDILPNILLDKNINAMVKYYKN